MIEYLYMGVEIVIWRSGDSGVEIDGHCEQVLSGELSW